MAFVKNRAGDVVEVSDDIAKNAGVFGYTLASPDEIAAVQAEAARKAEFSTLGQQVIGGAEALTRGASLGFSTPLQVALGADPERIKGRQEGLGGLGTALEFGGALAPILASGGAAAPGVAAGEVAGRTALQAAARAMPTARLSEAAAGVGERAATAIFGEAAAGVAPTLGQSLGRGAVQSGVSELVESVPYAAGQVATEAALGDLDLLSEEAAMTVGLGTILGGGLGAAFGAAGGGLGHALRKSQGAVDRTIAAFEKRYPAWIAGQVGADVDMLEQGFAQRRRLATDPNLKAEDLIGEQIPEVAPVAPFVKAAPPSDAVYVEGPDAPTLPDLERPLPYVPQDTVTVAGRQMQNPVLTDKQESVFAKDLYESLRETQAGMRDLQDEVNKSLRVTERRQLLDGVVPQEVAQEQAVKAARVIGDFATEGRRNGPERISASTVNYAENARDGILRNIVGPDDAAGVATVPTTTDIYNAIEDSVQQLQKERANISMASPQGSETKRRLNATIAALKAITTDESAWGAAAVRQKAINDKWASLISAEDVAMKFIANKEGRGSAARWVIDEDKVRALAKKARADGDPGSIQKVYRLLDRYSAFRDEVQQTADTIGAQTNRETIDSAEKRARDLFAAEKEARVVERGERKRVFSSKREQQQWSEWQKAKSTWEAQKRKERAAVEEARKSAAAVKMDEFKESEALRKEAIKKAEDDAATATRERAQTIKDEAKAWRAGAKWNGLMDIIGAGAVGQNPILAPFFVAYRFGKYLGSPDKTMRVLNELERQSLKARKAVDALAEQFARGERVRAVRAASSLAMSEAAIDSIVNDPESAVDVLAGSTAELRDFAPETAQRIEGTMISAAQYLASIRPKPSSGPMGTTIPPSAASVAQYESTKAVVEHPLDAYVLASEGRLMPRHVAALEQVWPRMLSQLRVATLDALVSVRTEGKTPSFRVLQQASVIFGQDLTQTVASGPANQRTMNEKPQQAQASPARADKVTQAQRSQTPWASEGN